MQDSPSVLPHNDNGFPEKTTFILAGNGSLEIVELLNATERLKSAGRKDKLVDLYRLWLENSTSPLSYVASFNLGVELAAERDYPQAEALYRKALAQNPNLFQARLNLGNCLEQQKREIEALEQWRLVIEAKNIGQPENKPFKLHALNNLGRLLETQRQYQEALDYLEISFATDPTQRDVLIHLVHLKQKTCKWPLYSPPKGTTSEEMIHGTSPLAMLAASDDPALQLAAAKHFVEYKFPASNIEGLTPQGVHKHKKIRIGYLSSDFCLHAVSLLTVELLELHDRDQFEVYGFCWSREDGTPLRKRVVSAMDHYVRIEDMSDKEAADCIRSHEIDILVDLQGLTSGARPLILSYRPVSVQMTYLGFPGTTALPWIDYVIADNYLIPAELAPYHTEKPLYLPNCFQVSDSKREVGPLPARTDYGLPEKAFVFCSFNNNYKFTPEMFAAWMQILKRVPGSVLWLLADNEWARENLCQVAKKHKIKKDRLIFAPRVPPADYLARYQLADLFLDTFPFNGGTTANDALFMGLPLLALSGRTFGSRMAGSLLTHLGLPELITTSLKEYEERAVRLAQKPAELNLLKNRLHESKVSSPVFDTPSFVKSYETTIIHVLREIESTAPCSSEKNQNGIENNSTLPERVTFTQDWTGDHKEDISSHIAERSLLVQGWLGINHSYSMVNQYQLLALSKDRNIKLYTEEMPYFYNEWNKEKNSAGFNDSERQLLSRNNVYSGEKVSAVYRIYSPNSLENGSSRIITFLVSELGLNPKDFTPSANISSYTENGNLVVTPSYWSRERIIDFGFSAESVFVIPHGVDSEKFSPMDRDARSRSRSALEYTEEDVIFLNVGAPIWNKGLDLTLKAFFRVRERHGNVRLLIKDQQSLYGLSVQQMISNLVATGEIKMGNSSIESIRVIPATLSIEQLRTLYCLADYYISPYRAEGFNLPVIEAIACGTPAIVTGGGSTDDFCDELTSIKIPSTKHEHTEIQNTKISAYLEPDFDALVQIWGKCAEGNSLDSLHFSFGRRDLIEKFTWDRAARLLTSLF